MNTKTIYSDSKKKIEDFIDSLIEEKLRSLKTREGLRYLINKYPRPRTFDESINRELISIYDEINCDGYLHITGKILEIDLNNQR